MPDSSLNTFDAKIVDSCKFTINTSSGSDISIEFQFAPKITSDSNSSEWLTEDVWSIEPLNIHKGSSGRKISMEWEYVATDPNFTGTKIAGILRKLKTYFFEYDQPATWYPIVKVQYTEVIPILTHFRLKDCQISHGPEITDQGGKLYHLYTKVSVKLELATNLANPLSEGDPLIEIDPLKSVVPEWY